MNRADRIRRQIPAADDDLVAALAAKPAAEVDMIVAALRQARRDALDHEKARRQQRRTDARRNRWYDREELTGRNVRLLHAADRRAATGQAAALAELAGMAELTVAADRVIASMVARAREAGLSDGDIGQALGITRQAVGQKYGRKHRFTPGGLCEDGGGARPRHDDTSEGAAASGQ